MEVRLGVISLGVTFREAVLLHCHPPSLTSTTYPILPLSVGVARFLNISVLEITRLNLISSGPLDESERIHELRTGPWR